MADNRRGPTVGDVIVAALSRLENRLERLEAKVDKNREALIEFKASHVLEYSEKKRRLGVFTAIVSSVCGAFVAGVVAFLFK